MKVTKIVREFVEEKINEKYPMPVLDEEAKKALDNQYQAILNKLKDELAQKLLVKAREAGIPLDEKIARCSVSTTYYDKDGRWMVKTIHNPIQEAYDEQLALVEKKRKNALTNIFVSLELGGSKSELTEMLNNLPD